jgi:hypothetical protein
MFDLYRRSRIIGWKRPPRLGLSYRVTVTPAASGPPARIIKIPEGAGKEEKFLFMRLKTIKTSHRRDIAIFISGYD